ncbi:hypothetical protein Tco_0467576 [Tanacetum coccineum]
MPPLALARRKYDKVFPFMQDQAVTWAHPMVFEGGPARGPSRGGKQSGVGRPASRSSRRPVRPGEFWGVGEWDTGFFPSLSFLSFGAAEFQRDGMLAIRGGEIAKFQLNVETF